MAVCHPDMAQLVDHNVMKHHLVGISVNIGSTVVFNSCEETALLKLGGMEKESNK